MYHAACKIEFQPFEQVVLRPMTMKTRCSKVIFPKYSKKGNRLKIRAYRRYGEHGEKKNVRFSRIIFSRCCTCTRRNLRFHVENCQHADQKQLTRRLDFDLDIEATHGQPGSCRARPVNVDDGLEYIKWIRGLGGEKLPAASYALLPNLKKGLFCAIGEGSIFLSPVFYTAAPKCVSIRRLAGARHLSPAVL